MHVLHDVGCDCHEGLSIQDIEYPSKWLFGVNFVMEYEVSRGVAQVVCRLFCGVTNQVLAWIIVTVVCFEMLIGVYWSELENGCEDESTS